MTSTAIQTWIRPTLLVLAVLTVSRSVVAESDQIAVDDWQLLDVVEGERTTSITRDELWAKNTLPECFTHRATGLEFVLVPANTYSIGDDAQEDSANIEVQLSPYYFCASEVKHKHLSVLAHRVFLCRRDERLREFSNLHGAEALNDQAKSVANLWACIEVSLDTMPELIHAPAFSEAVTGLTQHNNMDKSPLEWNLSPEQIQRIEAAVTIFEKHICDLATSQEPQFSKASYYIAMQLAQAGEFSLPTEAQWEVAAALTERGELSTIELLDENREWCSDFYSQNYFARESGFVDPIGPPVGYLSKKQRVEHSEDLALAIRIWMQMRRLRVLRGNGVSGREFALSYNNAFLKPTNVLNNRGIRLVVMPSRVDENSTVLPASP